MYKILSTVPIQSFPEVCEILESAGEVIYLDYPSYSDVMNIIDDVDGLFPNARMKVDSILLKNAKKLKIISMPAMGTDHIDVEECKKRNIKLFSMSDSKDFMRGVSSTAEYTVGMILLLMKKYLSSSQSVLERGEWKAADYRGYDINGKRVGIIGYGVVGSQVEKILLGFGADVVKYDPYIEKYRTKNLVDLDTLLSTSDIITCHIPLSPETNGMINKECFDKMKGVYFINASRGEVIDDYDLMTAMESGNIRAAALDVLSGEAEGSIWKHPLVEYSKSNSNLFITPHCAGSSNDGLKRVFKHAAETLINNLEG